MVQVYREPLCRRYYGNILGEAFLFRVVAYLSAIVLAFVIAFSTGGFWPKMKPDNVQADVHYTYDALVYFQASHALLHADGLCAHSSVFAEQTESACPGPIHAC